MKEVIVDLTGLIEDDDGSTTRYDGSFTVGQEVLRATGTDRDLNGWLQDLVAEVACQLSESIDLYDDVFQALEEADINLCSQSVFKAVFDGSVVRFRPISRGALL